MKVLHEEGIHDEFLSKSDREYLTELVGDWLAERTDGDSPESFEFQITVNWEEGK